MIRQRLVLQPQQIEQISTSKISLTSEQQHYLGKVLRLRAGAEFIAMDGRVNRWRAVLTQNVGEAEVLEQISTNFDLETEITLAIAMPKGNGMEAVIRQTTELGVNKIMPLWSDRTVIRPHTSIGSSKLERWLKIAQEISEQSHRTVVPQIHEPMTLADTMPKFNDMQIAKYICVTPKPTPHLLNSLLNLDQVPTKIVILTGTEGGWTESETNLAIAHNFQTVSLGDRILAAVTAPVVALSIVTAVIESHRC